jgi:hypothetical protein
MPEVERALRKEVRRKLQTGALPLTKRVQISAGPGEQRICAACDLPITKKRMEYEIECDAPAHAPLNLHMHLTCSRRGH